ncbi:hypothetical protein ES702_01917 [subsurface metagenome]
MLKYFLLLVLIPLGLILTAGCQNNKVFAPPPEPYVPSNVNATAISSEEIELVWDDNSVDEKGFYVYRKDNGDYRRIVALDANTTFYKNSGLDPASPYWYQVSCYNDGGESGLSNEALATTMMEVEILDYHMDKEPWYNAQWRTQIKGHVRNNTIEEISTIKLGGEFYKEDKWIAMQYGPIYNVSPAKEIPFTITHWGGTEITRVTAWIEEYY